MKSLVAVAIAAYVESHSFSQVSTGCIVEVGVHFPAFLCLRFMKSDFKLGYRSSVHQSTVTLQMTWTAAALGVLRSKKSWPACFFCPLSTMETSSCLSSSSHPVQPRTSLSPLHSIHADYQRDYTL
uniref:Uncharacterized protein n=1 Tax=Kalanchoe fedtschenkoi TaxID=63787 RepID=A0A7N0RD92_KALFE